MKYWKWIVALVMLSPPAYSREIGDLSPVVLTGVPTNLPLGLPEIAWWLIVIAVLCLVVRWVSHRIEWLSERLSEPSTHISVACFFGFAGVFLNSLVLDPVPLAQALLLMAIVFAFLGLIGRDSDGSLLGGHR